MYAYDMINLLHFTQFIEHWNFFLFMHDNSDHLQFEMCTMHINSLDLYVSF